MQLIKLDYKRLEPYALDTCKNWLILSFQKSDITKFLWGNLQLSGHEVINPTAPMESVSMPSAVHYIANAIQFCQGTVVDHVRHRISLNMQTRFVQTLKLCCLALAKTKLQGFPDSKNASRPVSSPGRVRGRTLENLKFGATWYLKTHYRNAKWNFLLTTNIL